MSEVIIVILMATGAALMLLAGIGILRMPDLFTRMHVATKSATLGVGCVLTAVAIFFGDVGVFTRALLVILFFFLTAPVGAHLIGRAGYIVGVPLWEGTKWDELKGKYDHSNHTLNSPKTLKTRVPDPDSPHARDDT
ncbi:MAG: monovalent cation/H(+) antiporter subunit G [Sphaerobacteraceae bacterium]|nr:MAG: monovalent cation/H(+) antiporter subunit G [Sphaerobacteraceae bacterium]